MQSDTHKCHTPLWCVSEHTTDNNNNVKVYIRHICMYLFFILLLNFALSKVIILMGLPD